MDLCCRHRAASPQCVTCWSRCCVFAGAVHDSVTQLPLAKASVRLRSRKPNQPSYTAITDADGAFRFEAVAPGDYVVELSARGYRPAAAVSLKPGQAASWLHFSAGQSITGAVAALDPPAVVSGRVTDADGEPMAGAQVEALARHWQSGLAMPQTVASSVTGEHGEYRLSLNSGRYFLSASPHEGGSVPTLFVDGPGRPETTVASIAYPNSPGFDGAAEFDLHPGQQLGGIDFKLPTVVSYHVRGSVQPAELWRNGFLTLHRRDSQRFGMRGTVVKNGAFDFPGVPPGTYWMRVESFRGARASGKMPVEVTDRDVNGVVFHLIPASTLKGRVRFDDSGPHDLSQVHLQMHWLGWQPGPGGLPATPKPDGSFQFDSVPAGEFAVQLYGQGDFYVESVAYNHREAPGGKLDLNGGPAGELEVVLATGTGQVSGTIHWPDVLPGAPPPVPTDMAAVLVAANGVTGNTGVRVLGIDQDGRFQFRGVPPGRYFVWATPHFDEGHWQNMEFVTEMQSRGVAVELAKKGSVQVEISEVVE
jgi:hypothetical protein